MLKTYSPKRWSFRMCKSSVASWT